MKLADVTAARPMTRAYRFLVTVLIEADAAADCPAVDDVAEHVATMVQDADDHNLAVCVRAIETQDTPGFTDDAPQTDAIEAPPRRRRRRPRCGAQSIEGYRCTLNPGHGGDVHQQTTHPAVPTWPVEGGR